MDSYISVLATIAIVLLTLSMGVGAAEVPYISGGVGADMREELLAKEKEYNLKIVVAEKSGSLTELVQFADKAGCHRSHVLSVSALASCVATSMVSTACGSARAASGTTTPGAGASRPPLCPARAACARLCPPFRTSCPHRDRRS